MIARVNGTGGNKRLVVAFVNTNTESGRAELRGVTGTLRRLGCCCEAVDLAYADCGVASYLPLLSRASGVITRHDSVLEDGVLASLGIPLVGIDVACCNKSGDGWDERRTEALWADVLCNDRDVARAGAGELIATGRRVLGVIPALKRYPWSWERERHFMEAVSAAGRDARRYEPSTDWDWAAERTLLAEWLAALPRPFGLFAVNDRLAVLAAEACRDAGLAIPRDAAVIGADDDRTLCLAADPPLSSVRLDFEGAGRLAAEALESFFGRKRPKAMRKLAYGVLGVARRGSTRCGARLAPTADEGGADDSRLSSGLDFITRRFADPLLGVQDVAVAMGVGRRQAYRLFASTGKTIRSHIEATRLARVREMLSETDIPVGEIAAACGFASANYFGSFIRRHLGASPTAWRAANRRSGK